MLIILLDTNYRKILFHKHKTMSKLLNLSRMLDKKHQFYLIDLFFYSIRRFFLFDNVKHLAI
jgi:hypothetical protein